MNRSDVDVLVVGAGASGTLVTAQLLRQTRSPLRILGVDATSAFGRGVAYATPTDVHLLNVPAAKMTGLPGDPEHFLRWLRTRQPDAQPTDFAPRRDYGTYLRALLHESARNAPAGTKVTLRAAEVTALSPLPHRSPAGHGPRWTATLSTGEHVTARAAVLAMGAPTSREGPWVQREGFDVHPNAPILLVGTGLTLVDAALELSARGHRGILHALSRHGLLPRPHEPVAALTWKPREATSLSRLTREVREKIAEVQAQGGNWRSVVDSLRPHTADLWGKLGLTGQRRFLRHLRADWDVHRHRMAPEIARGIQTLLSSGQLQIQAGRIQSITPARGGSTTDLPAGYQDVRYRPRGEASSRSLRVARVIHCTGQESSLQSPLVRGLLDRGDARADGLRFGLVTGPTFRCTEGLYALGPLLRGMLWESVAVPEIRVQAETVARALLDEELARPGG